jgi:hypothetical protein
MFVFTAKFNKKKAIMIVIALAVLLLAIILIAGSISRGKAKDAGLSGTNLRSNEDRIAYLNALGWEVSDTPLDTQEIVIPREFTGVYEEYVSLQKEQGFNLDKYGGMEAVRYTYKILNYPGGDDTVVADLIICKNRLIAGDIQSTALNGFMHGMIQNSESP